MKNKYTVSLYSIIMFLLYIVSFSTISASYWPEYNYIKYLLILIIALYLFSKAPMFFRKEFRKINGLLLLFTVSTIYVSYINKNFLFSRDTLLASIVFSLIFIELFFSIEVSCTLGKMKALIDLYYRITLVWCLFIDLSLFVFPNLIFQNGTYIVGTKFQICYLNMLLFALALAKGKLNFDKKKENRKQYNIAIIFVVVNLCISLKVNCMTGVIGIVISFLLFAFISQKGKILKTPLCLFICLLLSFIFIFVFDYIVSNRIIQTLVTELFQRDLTLTGRTDIYVMLPTILKDHWLTGYGYGSEYEVCRRYFAYADVQNGLMSWILQVGVLVTTVLIIIMLSIFKIMNKNESIEKNQIAIMALIYSFIIIGTIEISYSMLFFGVFALLFGISIENSTKKNK